MLPTPKPTRSVVLWKSSLASKNMLMRQCSRTDSSSLRFAHTLSSTIFQYAQSQFTTSRSNVLVDNALVMAKIGGTGLQGIRFDAMPVDGAVIGVKVHELSGYQ